MFCHKCGNKMVEDSSFCNKCGAKQQAEAPAPIVSAAPQESTTKSNKLNKKIPVFAGIAGVLVVVIILAIIFSRGNGEPDSQADTNAPTAQGIQQLTPTEEDWITLRHMDEFIGMEMFNVSIPASFTFEESHNGFDISGDGFALFVGYFRRNDDHWEWLEYGWHENQFGEAVRREVFTFGDSRLGLLVESDDAVFIHDGAYFLRMPLDDGRSMFTDNEDLILQIARSIIPATGDAFQANDNELLYNGVSVWQLFMSPIDDVLDLLGDYVEHGWYHGGSYYSFGGITFVYNEDTRIISHAFLNPSAVEADGQPLNTNRDGIVDLLGEPSWEGSYFDEINLEYRHTMEYLRYGIVKIIMLPGTDAEAREITLSWMMDGPGDDWVDASTFRRSDYFTGLSYTDLVRFPDNHSFSRVFFDQYIIRQIFEPGVYLAEANTMFGAGDFIIVDNRGQGGARGMAGDRIAVYGVFTGTDPVTDGDGRVEMLPLIRADRLIFNNFLPTPEDMAEAIVEILNAHPYSYGQNSQHLGGTRVQLHVAAEQIDLIRVLQPTDWGIPRITGPRADGFATSIVWQGPTLTDFGITGPRNTLEPCIPILVTGSIVYIRQNMGDPSMLTITIAVEDIVLP